MVELFKWLLEEAEIEVDPMARMKPPSVPEVPVPVVSDEDLRRLLKACSGKEFEDRRDTALIRIASASERLPRQGGPAWRRRVLPIWVGEAVDGPGKRDGAGTTIGPPVSTVPRVGHPTTVLFGLDSEPRAGLTSAWSCQLSSQHSRLSEPPATSHRFAPVPQTHLGQVYVTELDDHDRLCRMDITGARWSVEGAEAILKLRAVRSNDDFDKYWTFHLDHERQRIHESRYAEWRHPSRCVGHSYSATPQRD